MNYIIQAHSPPEIEDQYLVSFDFDAMNGCGYGIFSDWAEHAMRFKSLRDAMEFWRTQSTVKPLRPDGCPNRPLTASTISIFKLKENDDGLTAEETRGEPRRRDGGIDYQG